MKRINPHSIAILMATYNGGKYLVDQIESIIHQTETNWTLYIQDDGSTDNTRAIIEAYATKDSRILHVDCGLTHQGACNNFMTLLNVVESDYYLFADQDDVWLSHKIAVSINKIKELESLHGNKPILIATDSIRVDEQLNTISTQSIIRKKLSENEIQQLIRERCSADVLRLLPPTQGCAMAFNHAAKTVAFPYINARFHDYILPLSVATHNGIVDILLDQTMLYRRHSDNTSGLNETPPLKKFFRFTDYIKGQHRMYLLYKLYGGEGLCNFIRSRIKLYKYRGF